MNTAEMIVLLQSKIGFALLVGAPRFYRAAARARVIALLRLEVQREPELLNNDRVNWYVVIEFLTDLCCSNEEG